MHDLRWLHVTVRHLDHNDSHPDLPDVITLNLPRDHELARDIDLSDNVRIRHDTGARGNVDVTTTFGIANALSGRRHGIR